MSMHTDPMLTVDIIRVREQLNIDTFVETGTEYSHTLRIAQWYFKKMYSCEIDEEKINRWHDEWVTGIVHNDYVNDRDAKVILSDYSKERILQWHNPSAVAKVIKLYPKSSLECLEEIFTEIGHDNFILYLDSHIDHQENVGYIPLLDELEIVHKMNIKPFIVIHDFKNSTSGFRSGSIYDNDKELSYDLVKDSMDNIFGENNYIYRESKESYVYGEDVKVGAGYFWKKELGNIFEKYDKGFY